MGFFSKFRKSLGKQEFTPLTEAEAWLGILIPCAAADGEICNMEIKSLLETLMLREVFLNADAMNLYERVMRLQAKLGNEKLIVGAASKLKAENRNTVFCLAIDLVLADGYLHENEEKIIEFIANKLNIEREMSDKIVEVLLIKNRGKLVTA